MNIHIPQFAEDWSWSVSSETRRELVRRSRRYGVDDCQYTLTLLLMEGDNHFVPSTFCAFKHAADIERVDHLEHCYVAL
jgi:hypothetical protein